MNLKILPVLLLALMAMASDPALATAPQTIGSAATVGPITTTNLMRPDVAMDADGDYAVCAMGDDPAFVEVRAYERDGRLRWSAQTNSPTPYRPEGGCAVALDAQGYSGIVTWLTADPTNTSGYYQIFARRIGSGGFYPAPALIETLQAPTPLDVEMDKDGNYVVAWTYGGSELNAAIYDKNGIFKAYVDLANDFHTAIGGFDVAMGPHGQIVMAWSSPAINGGWPSVKARRYSATGTALGASFKVAPNAPLGTQDSPSVGVALDGSFAVAWRQAGQLYLQSFKPTGAVNYGQVTMETSGDAQDVRIGVDALGGVRALWQRGTGVAARLITQRYSMWAAAEAAIEIASGEIHGAAVAVDADGETVAAWVDEGLDPGASTLRLQRLRGGEPVDLAVMQSGPGSVKPGAIYSYSIQLTNLHPAVSSPTGNTYLDNALGSAVIPSVTVTLSSGLTYVSYNDVSTSDWTCTTVFGIRCTLKYPLLAAKTTSPLVITVRAPSSNGVTVSSTARIAPVQLDSVDANNLETDSTKTSYFLLP